MMTEILQSIAFGSTVIKYSFAHQERKSLSIKVYPDGSVKVAAPFDKTEIEIQNYLKKKAPWIIKQQREFLSYHPLTPARLYINGETHLYLGRQYKLRIETESINDVKLYRGHLIIYCCKKGDAREILNKWYRERAVIHFNEMLDKTFPLFSKFKISKPDLQIRQMEKRWGSCTPNGKVILNPELIKAPKGSIEYVVIHELCHLIHHNHTKHFYDLQESLMPDWKKWKERLEHSLS
ncbi:M48 family metallopeptidase [Sphingobacterium spiritivorum]|uniref:M48 family metallopeptidase n=1 Tax=Sphingobacterium spiritivorum TaxID=258 RepID=UPI003F763736